MEEDDGARRGIKHRVEYRERSIHIKIFPTECEIFVSSRIQDEDMLMAAELDALTRLITLSWKKTTLTKVVQQLRRASRTTRDLPGIFANLLMEDDFDDGKETRK